MKCPSPRSLCVALMGLSLTLFPGQLIPPVHGQDTPPPTAHPPAADPEKRLQELDQTIAQHLDAGEIAEVVPLARDYLGLLEHLRGKDHWQSGDARRRLETYQRLAGQTREVQN